MTLQARPRVGTGAKKWLQAVQVWLMCHVTGRKYETLLLYPIVSSVLQAVCIVSLIFKSPGVLPSESVSFICC